MERVIDRGVLAIMLVVLITGAAGGPGWTDSSGEAILAANLDRTAAAPLYGVLAGVFAHLPVGEPGFRVALLGALLGALLVLGVIRAARALLPKDPVAGLAGAVLLVLAPPFRDAAGFANPAILAACGVVWSLALATEHARTARPATALGAVAGATIAIGAAPWLGAPLLVVIGLWLARTGASPRLLSIGVGTVGAITILLWAGAVGRMPDPAPALGAVLAASGRGAAAVLVGAGLLGAAFAAITQLSYASWLALVIALVTGHAIFIDHDPTILLALFAVGAAVIPSAVVRVIPRQRHLVAAVSGVPLVVAAVLAGPAIGIDDPGAAPARLATDLLDDVPPGPGVYIATRQTTWSAIEYAKAITGARPDLALVPPLVATQADVVVANALRTHRIAAADVFAFGRLDPRRAFPRGRSFELLGAEPTRLARIPRPAHYRSAIGETESVMLALALARYEGGFGRLDAAAHAAGLTARFGAADLALLATGAPTRPALFGFMPTFDTPPGPWILELLGDDLAWVAGIEVPDVATPPARRLHALWRKLLAGVIQPDDPAIVALGPRAVKATADLVAAFAK